MVDHLVMTLSERLCMITVELSADTRLFKSVELYLGDGLEMAVCSALALDGETLNSYYWGLLGLRAFGVSRVILETVLKCQDYSVVTVGQRLHILCWDLTGRALWDSRVILRWSWNARPHDGDIWGVDTLHGNCSVILWSLNVCHCV